jgi:hypothetical protein
VRKSRTFDESLDATPDIEDNSLHVTETRRDARR